MIGYSKSRYLRKNSGASKEQPVSWEQGEKNAIQFVKTIFADRLGEIYYKSSKPPEDIRKVDLEQGEPYFFTFGWLVEGVPVEYLDFEVEISTTTGEVEYMHARRQVDYIEPMKGQIVTAKEAKEAEQKNKTLTLTYYLPTPTFSSRLEPNRQPILVYRLIGDDGVVDAATGEWISFAEIRKNQEPLDIADHPQKEALEVAMRKGLLSVTDGKLEPNKALTRGEVAQIMSRVLDEGEFRYRIDLRYPNESSQVSTFTDISSKHPLFGVLQKNLREGIIIKEGPLFEPDKLITRAQLADMLARLLGYGGLLNKPDIFVPAYSDIKKNQIPAVTLLHAEGIVFLGSSAGKFNPDGPVTKAEIAQLLKDLLDVQKQKNKN